MSFSGVYPITNDALLERAGHERVIDDVAAAGVAMLQFRAKHGDPRKARAQASRLLAICRPYGLPLIVNDDVELCAQCGADGVHLGVADCDIARAREVLGGNAIIGASCHDSLDLARRAQDSGADYVAFGRFFPSVSKPRAPSARIATLRETRASLAVPIAAIGGINRDNAAATLAAGADLLAVIHAVFGAPDPGAAARQLVALHAAAPAARHPS